VPISSTEGGKNIISVTADTS